MNVSKILIHLLISTAFVACSKSDFSGSGGNDSKGPRTGANGNPGSSGDGIPGGGGVPGGGGATPGNGSGTTPGGSIPGPGGDLSTNQGQVIVNESVKCSAGLVSFISSTGTAQCPANSTPYAADDSSSALMACCALPKSDIFLTTVQPIIRGNQCADDEMIVGLQGNNMICQKIDLTKYQLIKASNACYYGKGATGKTGAGPCNAPNQMLNAIGARFGSDGCIAPPGAVIHGRKGSNCGDIPTRILQVVGGAPVAFPY